MTRWDLLSCGDGVVYGSPPNGSSTDVPGAKLVARARYRAPTTNRSLGTVARLLVA